MKTISIKGNKEALHDFVSIKIRDTVKRIFTAVSTLDYQYESKTKIFKFPLLSINLGFDSKESKVRTARGIIAIGSRAIGVIAIGVIEARGIFAIAYLTIGVFGISVAGMGLLTVSVFGIGAVSISIVAIGYFAVGVFAVGFYSVGIIAFGYESYGIIAIGGKAVSLFFR